MFRCSSHEWIVEESVNDRTNPTVLFPDPNNIEAKDPTIADRIPPISFLDDATPVEESLNGDVTVVSILEEGENTTTEQPANVDTIPSLLIHNVSSSDRTASNNVTPQDILLQNDLTTQAVLLPQGTRKQT